MSANLFTALAKAQQSITPLEKNVKVQGFMGVSADDVVAQVKSVLLANDIVAVASVVDVTRETVKYKSGGGAYKCNALVDVTLIYAPDPTQRLIVRGTGSGIDSGDKAPGKATTYAKKYALMNALLMTTHDNEEQPPPGEVDHEPDPMSEGQHDMIKQWLSQDVFTDAERTTWDAWLKKSRNANDADRAIERLAQIANTRRKSQ